MALGNTIVLCQATGYCVALMMAICFLVPMSLNQSKFRGHCLLFTTGTFRESDGNLVAKWASPFYCIFPMVIGALVAIVATVQVMRMGVFLYRNIDSSFLSAFLDAIFSVLLTILVFSTSISFTLGFRTWCNTVMERFPSCDNAALTEIDKDDNISTLDFYLEIGSALFGIWTSFVTWVFLSVLACWKLAQYHERENIIVSMARERQRIINADQQYSELT